MTVQAEPGTVGLVHVSEVEVRPGTYGNRITSVEPGGAEFIPIEDRHGRPLDLLWTWTSPNMEFATIFVGVLGVLAFGLSFWQSVLAIVLGTGLGAFTQSALSARGPGYGVPQMILSRVSFGFLGNILPAGLNAVMAGIGWFAVNSVSGALALNTLLGLPKVLSLVIIVAAQLTIAMFGHNLVHLFEKLVLPLLVVGFLLATVVTLSKAHPSAHGTGGGIGGFLLMFGTAFGYAAGWNPYATDYTRYLKPDTSKFRVGLFSGLGVFLSCVVLEVVGAASMTIGGPINDNPTAGFTGHLPTAIADITLLAIALGAISANAINIYSGALSFLCMGVKLPLSLQRAIVALGFGTLGFILAITGLHDAGTKYENFLLVIAYWVGPWLGVYFTDQVLRRGERVDWALFDTKYRNWAGPIAMLVAMGISIWLFSNQTEYVGVVPKHVSQFGDVTFLVGFAIAALIYGVAFMIHRPTPAVSGEVLDETPVPTLPS